MNNSEISQSDYPPQNLYPIRERLKEEPVLFLAEKSTIKYEELEQLRQQQGAEVLYACDFYIDGIEPDEKDGFFQRGQVANIDHHSEAESMKRMVSSVNLVLEYVKNLPEYKNVNYAVATHHVDCDSVLSTLILRGVLPPEERFGQAAIAADHTGEANDIADLLQAIKRGPEGTESTATQEENITRFEYVVKNLELFLNGRPIEPLAQKQLQNRLDQRESLLGIRQRGEFGSFGPASEVIFLPTQAESRLDPTLLIGVYPEAKVIFTYYQLENGNYIYNCRLGKAAVPGTDLRNIMAKADLVFGGRWSAGANKRKTTEQYVDENDAKKTKVIGTAIKPEQYAQDIFEKGL